MAPGALVVFVALAWGAVPSSEASDTPSDGETELNAPLLCRYSSGEACCQGHQANARRSQLFMRCVIIVSLLSVQWLAITRYVGDTTTMSNRELYRNIVAQLEVSRQTLLQFCCSRAIIRWVQLSSSLQSA
jgi:hypothetical protein